MRWIVILSVVFLAIFYSVYIEPFTVHVEKITITTPKIPREESLRLVQISDLHMRSIGRREKKVIDKVRMLDPDYVVITGDLFKTSGDFERYKSPAFNKQLDDITRFILQLHDPERIFLVRGNHDFGNDKESSNILVKQLREHYINVLTNNKIKLHEKSFNWYLLGIDYPEFVADQVTFFTPVKTDHNHVLESGQSLRNSYSHFFDIDPSRWHNYIFSGRLRLMGHADAIGVTFYSQAHRGLDEFYRLRVYKNRPTMHFDAHGPLLKGENLDTHVDLKTGQWYHFKIRVQTLADRTTMAAKVWNHSVHEPVQWQATAADTSIERLKNGTIGVWSAKFGKHQFDDIRVTRTDNHHLHFSDFTPPAHGWVDFNYEVKALDFLCPTIPDSAFSVLLAHSPDIVQHASRKGIDLQLSGHTHGGQVCLPGWGALFSRTNLDRKYMSGLHHYKDTQIYINRGIGTANIPVRLFCPPEITLFQISHP
jgi:predicted MPP superfamily phosphohydrolase